MTFLIGLVSAIALVAIVGLVVGWRMPAERDIRRQADVFAPVEQVYDLVAAVDRFALWRPEVQRVEWIGERRPPRWMEYRTDGRRQMEDAELHPPTQIVHRLATPSGGFRGQWTFDFEALGPDRTRLTITESGRMTNPLLRAFWGFLVHQDRDVQAWLDAVTAAMVARSPEALVPVTPGPSV